MFLVLGVTVVMIIVHEIAHAIVTQSLGGYFEGVEFRSFPLMVGVKLRVDGLSRPALATTLWAGPVSEVIVLGLAAALDPQHLVWWAMIWGLEWGVNLIPWSFIPNDGTRLWRLWRGIPV